MEAGVDGPVYLIWPNLQYFSLCLKKLKYAPYFTPNFFSMLPIIIFGANFLASLVGCPCVATAYNNIHLNDPSKKFQEFLLIISALCIIYFLIWLTDVIVYSMQICLGTTRPMK
jgi:hypothetical protein